MAAEPEPFDPLNPSFSISFDSVPIPDDDVDFPLPSDIMEDFDFDQLLDFSMEDLLSLPSSDHFDLPPGSGGFPDHSNSDDGSGVSFMVDASGDQMLDADVAMMSCLDGGCPQSVPGDRCSDVARVLNSPSSESLGSPDRSSSGSRSCNPISDVARALNPLNPSKFSGSPGPEVSGAQCSDVARFLKSPSPSPESFESPDRCSSGSASCYRSREVAEVSNSQDFHREVSGSLSGDGSPDSGSDDQGFSGSGAHSSDAFRVLNSPSSDSGSSSLDSSNVSSAAVAAEQRIKLEDGSKGQLSKRKKGNEDGITDSRTSKFRRSFSSGNGNSPGALRAGNDEDEKRQVRLMRNRESAQLSRQRKKHYVEELEDKIRSMHSTIAELNSKISFFMAENASLRQQLGEGGGYPAPPAMYPPPAMAPMPYPWVPCAPYALKPQGSQVPLIPIPRLKPQQPVSASKSKKSNSKKAEAKTKKVASVSFMGLLFFLLLIGGLVPYVGIRRAGRTQVPARLNFVAGGIDGGKSRGRVLAVSGHLNGSDRRGFGLYTEKEGYRKGGIEGMVSESAGVRNLPGVDGFEFSGNASEPLVASLYVPRNNKLVKIDGNLIIHSVLASEKAVASSRASRMKSAKPTVSSDKEVGKNGLAIAGNLASALAVSKSGRDLKRHSHMYRSPTEHPKALTSGSGDAYRDNLKSTTSDGPLQQWFREGLEGPVLNSGMCTEVFQFEISPTSAANAGAIIPTTSVVNASTEQHPESGGSSKLKNRRILYHPPIPLAGSTHNRTDEYGAESPKDGSFRGNKSVSSSMVVSVLIDPREAGDGDSDQMISPKSLSRILVVVLLDSVKYVTYSCVLPLKGSGPHVVAA